MQCRRGDGSRHLTAELHLPPSSTFHSSPPRFTSTSSPRCPSSARCGRGHGRPRRELEVIEGADPAPSPSRAGGVGLDRRRHSPPPPPPPWDSTRIGRQGGVAPLLHHPCCGIRARGRPGGRLLAPLPPQQSHPLLLRRWDGRTGWRMSCAAGEP